MKPLNPPLAGWSGRTVWVVGASSGIGLAVARALAQAGARVMVSARQAEPLERFAHEHPQALACPLDVTGPDAAHAAVDNLLERWGRLDLVVYCVGHYRAQRADAYDCADMQRHMEVNYFGALHVLDAVLPVLRSQRSGHISLVASVAGYRGLPQGLAYGPTKAALIHLAEVLYQDLRRDDVAVSVVNPGFVRTPLTSANTFSMPALIEPEEAARQMLAGWASGAFEIHFPRRFTWWLKLLRLLPYPLYYPAVRRVTGL